MTSRQVFKKAQKYYEKRQYRQAMNLCKPLIESAAASAETWNLWGKLLLNSGHAQEGINALNKACQTAPVNWQHLFDLAEQCVNLGMNQQALGIFDTLSRDFGQQDNPELLALSGQVNYQLGFIAASISAFKKGLALHPQHAGLQAGYATVIYTQGEFSEAEKILNTLLKEKNYKGLNAITVYSDILIKSGRHEEAYHFLDPIIKAASKPVLSLWSSYITACIGSDRHKGLAETVPTKNWQGGTLAQQALYYSLAALYEKQQDYKQAFKYYQAANDLFPPGKDSTHYAGVARGHINSTNKTLFDQLPRALSVSKKPIFVVGMPRSGTTLLERIIAQQDGVVAGGELPTMSLQVNQLVKSKGLAHSHELYAQLSETDVNTLAANYLSHLNSIDKNANHIVDKMPSNFEYSGLIALALPQAKVFHIRRNPMDVGLSCYCKNFHQSMDYTNAFDAIADYYHHYVTMMNHWHSVLGDQLITVQYESIIEDFNKETKTIYDVLGFQWNEAKVGAFYKNRKAVATASYNQVSQPLYHSAIGKWRRYEEELQPLHDAYLKRGIDPETGQLL